MTLDTSEEQQQQGQGKEQGQEPEQEQDRGIAVGPADGDRRQQAVEDAQEPLFTVLDRRFWTLDEEQLDQEEERPGAPSYVEDLKRQLADKDRQLKDYIAAYKAEVVEGLEKTKKRLERDAESRMEQLRGQVAEPMLEVLEALERSLVAAQTSASFDGLHEGVRMVHMLMVQKLQSLGLQRVATVGETFDPAVHEAVSVVPAADETQNNRVLTEFRAGFTLGDRLVRAAQVQVGKLG